MEETGRQYRFNTKNVIEADGRAICFAYTLFFFLTLAALEINRPPPSGKCLRSHQMHSVL